ncbi:parB-like partition protein (plasmid) [Gloeothece citriformis PCC 7424]|uniref:ParB-like partition protein n=1 Tax=Gloeothece citriformis (strain PCC 7424) TaxID=65393 RepID=B7KM60_GLOC7|nr:ParB/RepB/Spo0J family partition protein [Gloeothece citriformis]ACK73882.1 parB-like partition protein [Gloeothece citriformis PCC 7424]
MGHSKDLPIEIPTLGGVDALLGLGKPSSSDPPQTLPISDICLPQKGQPRHYFDPESLQDLIESVRQHGILQPLLVRPLEQGRYELVAGERRYRAASAVGLEKVPVYIKEMTAQEAWQLALVENLQRDGLNPIEETEGILKLLELRLDLPQKQVVSLLYRMQHEFKKSEVTQNVLGNPTGEMIEQMFNEVGRLTWQSFVTSRLPLLNLPEDILDVLRRGEIEYTKAKAIAKISDDEQRKLLLDEALVNSLSLNQIKEKVLLLEKTPTSQLNINKPKQYIKSLSSRLAQSNLWQADPQKWDLIKQKLQEIDDLL